MSKKKEVKYSRILICLMFCVALFNGQTAAQDIYDLEAAYSKKSVPLLEKFILKHRHVTKNKVHNDTTANLNAVVDELLNIYCGLKSIPSNKMPGMIKPGKEKYVILQPDIETAFVDHLDSTSLFGPEARKHRPNLFETGELYPHRNVYRNFASSGYYIFQDVKHVIKREYSVKPKGSHQLLIADTSLVKSVKLFLNNKGIEHYRRSNFLDSMVKLVNTKRMDVDASVGKIDYKLFNYNFLIDRIVFDRLMNRAFIQFAFPYETWEALFVKVNGKWNYKKAVVGYVD